MKSSSRISASKSRYIISLRSRRASLTSNLCLTHNECSLPSCPTMAQGTLRTSGYGMVRTPEMLNSDIKVSAALSTNTLNSLPTFASALLFASRQIFARATRLGSSFIMAPSPMAANEMYVMSGSSFALISRTAAARASSTHIPSLSSKHWGMRTSLGSSLYPKQPRSTLSASHAYCQATIVAGSFVAISVKCLIHMLIAKTSSSILLASTPAPICSTSTVHPSRRTKLANDWLAKIVPCSTRASM
mmetsp:Transcript_10276/g.24604  ORF Transcript_10276/g.24604 Transcript_10276/m.24604 type:complete len:246 (+) Transcript_10276:351-1088(+)